MNIRIESRLVRHLSLAAGAAFLILTFAARAAFAADPTDQTSAAAPDQLEDVIVTARRVEESEQRVPVALTALSARDLERQIVLDIGDLQTSTPGLFVTPSAQSNEPDFTIRGAKTASGTSPTVAVYIDDVPVNSTYAVANMVYDMQSITTLKGPQGTLFGANSTGGAIIFRPNKPTDAFEGYAQVGFGNYDRKEFQGMVNIPVNEVLQFRLAGEIVRRDGFETNITPSPTGPDNRKMDDDNHESARFSARLRLSDTLLNDTVVDYYDFYGQQAQHQLVAVVPTFSYPTFLGFSVPVSYAAVGVHPLPNFVVSTDTDPTWNNGHFYGVANTTTWDATPDWTLKNVIGYRHDATDVSTFYSDTGPRAPVLNGVVTVHNTNQWTLEPSSTFSWEGGNNKTGIFLYRAAEFTGVAGSVLGLPWDFTGLPASEVALVNSFYPLQLNYTPSTVFKSEAIYDEAAVKLSKDLTFTAGARYTWDQGDYIAANRTAFPSTPNGGDGPYGDYNYGPCSNFNYQNYNPVTCTGTRSVRSGAPSFTLSLEDQFAERKMMYTSLRGGYLTGGFNNQVSVPAGQVFGPEKVTAVEGGLKADWDVAGRPLRTNVAIFYGTYRDQQRLTSGTSAQGLTYIAVSNAGSSLFYGTDIDLNYAPTNYLELSLSYEHLVAYYTNYTAALSEPTITAAVDLTGSQLAQAPKDLYTASATVKWPVPDGLGALSSTLSFFYRSWSYARDAPTIGGSCAGNTPTHPVTTCTAPGTFIPNPAQNYTALDVLKAFGLINLTTQCKGIGGTHLDAEIWVKNLANRFYSIYSENQMTQFGYATIVPGDPRTFGVRLRYNF